MAFEYGHRFTRKAASDVTGIVDYLAGELENPSAAAAFKKKLQGCMETLRQFPQSGSFVRNAYLPAWNVRWKPVGRYLLLYRVNGDEQMIEVLRVVYGKQNMEDVVQNLSN